MVAASLAWWWPASCLILPRTSAPRPRTVPGAASPCRRRAAAAASLGTARRIGGSANPSRNLADRTEAGDTVDSCVVVTFVGGVLDDSFRVRAGRWYASRRTRCGRARPGAPPDGKQIARDSPTAGS